MIRTFCIVIAYKARKQWTRMPKQITFARMKCGSNTEIFLCAHTKIEWAKKVLHVNIWQIQLTEPNKHLVNSFYFPVPARVWTKPLWNEYKKISSHRNSMRPLQSKWFHNWSFELQLEFITMVKSIVSLHRSIVNSSILKRNYQIFKLMFVIFIMSTN